jgi:TRAP-type uncharacterized transport system fused permease subunit
MTAALGVLALAAAFGGWIRSRASTAERILAAAAGLLLCYAARWADVAGIATLAVVLFLHFGRRPPAATE